LGVLGGIELVVVVASPGFQSAAALAAARGFAARTIDRPSAGHAGVP
jgi:hypothetical protein